MEPFDDLSSSPTLIAALKRAASHVMTPAERHAQRRSWVIGQIMCSHPEMTREEAERLADGAVGPNLTARVAELEALNAQLRERVDQFEAREAARRASVVCPWDAMDDERSDIPETEPCPVCGMLGTPGAEDKCLGGPRRDPRPAPQAQERDRCSAH